MTWSSICPLSVKPLFSFHSSPSQIASDSYNQDMKEVDESYKTSKYKHIRRINERLILTSQSANTVSATFELLPVSKISVLLIKYYLISIKSMGSSLKNIFNTRAGARFTDKIEYNRLVILMLPQNSRYAHILKTKLEQKIE